MTSNLDPLPYECEYAPQGRCKYAAGHNTFAPRPGYSQNPKDYS